MGFNPGFGICSKSSKLSESYFQGMLNMGGAHWIFVQEKKEWGMQGGRKSWEVTSILSGKAQSEQAATSLFAICMLIDNWFN